MTRWRNKIIDLPRKARKIGAFHDSYSRPIPSQPRRLRTCIRTSRLLPFFRIEVDHVGIDGLYTPTEDTFLLLDALENDAVELRNLRPAVCLEIGSGSGCVSAFIGSILGPSAALYLCTDINFHACRCTLATGRQNKVPLEPIATYLDHSLQSRLGRQVDLIVFNPPYVPTPSEEADLAQSAGGIAGAWAGGQDGMVLTNVFLTLIPELLAPGGRVYLVAVKENNIPQILSMMAENYGMTAKVALQRRAGREHLHILRFTYQ